MRMGGWQNDEGAGCAAPVAEANEHTSPLETGCGANNEPLSADVRCTRPEGLAYARAKPLKRPAEQHLGSRSCCHHFGLNLSVRGTQPTPNTSLWEGLQEIAIV